MISRYSLFAVVCLAGSLSAAPTLTTIQDTLYRADGSRFTGTLTVSWDSFEGPNATAVVKQSTTVRVVDGYLKVQLVPTTTSVPPAYYQVTYNSDGRVQFQETWNVPASAQPVRVRDVRVAVARSTSGGTASGETGGPVTEADVSGLLGDLAVRPIKGAGYAGGRVAMVNDSGALESVAGSPSDCVRVDGTSGPCGSEAPGFVEGDTPSGIVDGANTTFSLTGIPEPADSLAMYRNGLRQKAGLDYISSGRTVEFVPAAVPQPGDTLLASYRLADGSESAAPEIYPVSQVVCSGIGAATNSSSMSALGSCTVPAAALLPGDRLEVRFDVEHQGSGGGYTFELLWGSTVVLSRSASAADAVATARADFSVLGSGTQFGTQSWGSVLPLAAAVGAASDSLAGGITVVFRGRLTQAGDTLTLRNFTVTRLP